MQVSQELNKSTFDILFREMYQELCRFAYRYVRDEDICQDIVQEVFIKFWEKRNQIKEIQSLESYLKRSVRNASIDYIRKEVKFNISSLDEEITDIEFHDYSLNSLEDEELKNKIEDSISDLPVRCRDIFILSREAKLSYIEIAEELGVTRKTVENQIGIALKKIRKHLIENNFITIFLILAVIFFLKLWGYK